MIRKEYKPYLGEFIGTFILVFIGCGSVAFDVLFGVPGGLYGVAAIWGIGVSLAIYSTQKYSSSHLNPAVSLAFMILKPYSTRHFTGFVIFQFIGALLAGLAVYGVFYEPLLVFEFDHEIIRGSAESAQTSKVFGEFYHTVNVSRNAQLSTMAAIVAEAVGTFALVFTIFILIHLKRINHLLIPALIGLIVAILIVFIAPYTQAGLNPARDFGPRLIAFLFGWKEAAFPPVQFGFFTVYILGPFCGAAFAAVFYKFINPTH